MGRWVARRRRPVVPRRAHRGARRDRRRLHRDRRDRSARPAGDRRPPRRCVRARDHAPSPCVHAGGPRHRGDPTAAAGRRDHDRLHLRHRRVGAGTTQPRPPPRARRRASGRVGRPAGATAGDPRPPRALQRRRPRRAARLDRRRLGRDPLLQRPHARRHQVGEGTERGASAALRRRTRRTRGAPGRGDRATADRTRTGASPRRHGPRRRYRHREPRSRRRRRPRP